MMISLGLAVVAFSCRGYDTIPAQEADWKLIQPELAGTSSAELWRCAGPPLREETSPSGVSAIVYRYATAIGTRASSIAATLDSRGLDS